MKPRLLCSALFFVFFASANARAGLIVGPNVNITRTAGYQGEEAIAINPLNPQQLFAFANQQAAQNFMMGATSSDGGTTWAQRTFATGSDRIPATGGDPTGVFDKYGNLFIAYLNQAATQIVVAVSTNGGASFTQVGTALGGTSVDQPTITVGPSNTGAGSSVWVTYTNSAGAIVARGAAVNGAGLANVGAFTAEQVTPTSNGTGFGDIAVSGAGRVSVVYQSPNGNAGPSNILVSQNPNGLAATGFNAAVTATATNVGGFRAIPAQPNRTIDAETGLAFDRSGGPHNGRLYMIYTDAPSTISNDTDIFLRYSDDNGAIWSARNRINDDATANSQFFSKIAVDLVTGDVAIAWYDARNDPGNKKVELWATASTDGGQTFLPNAKISAGTTDGTQANIGNGNELGDYIGLAIYNDVFYPVWGDASNSTGNNPDGMKNLDVYTARVVVPEPATAGILLLAALAGLGMRRKSRRNRKRG